MYDIVRMFRLIVYFKFGRFCFSRLKEKIEHYYYEILIDDSKLHDCFLFLDRF